MSEKMMTILKNCKNEEGVNIFSDFDNNSDFETTYINIRKKENRLYDDQIVSDLPYSKNVIQKTEWAMRAKSARRVAQYFKEKEGNLLLDLGCGNGWFSSLLAQTGMKVFSMDVNMIELKQAARIFQNENLYFLYADIFQTQLPEKEFDYIAINASVQYFKDFSKLILRLFELLKDNGEIHIIDSPFYKKQEIKDAKERTQNYYKEIGFEKMADFYFHHSYEDLESFNYKVLYQPVKMNIISKLFCKPDIPFPWIRIAK